MEDDIARANRARSIEQLAIKITGLPPLQGSGGAVTRGAAAGEEGASESGAVKTRAQRHQERILAVVRLSALRTLGPGSTYFDRCEQLT